MKSQRPLPNTISETVSPEEFHRIIRELRPTLSEAQVQRGRAYQFKDTREGVETIRILIKEGALPNAFLPYLETHERWEAHVAQKKGFNLVDRARREARKALRAQFPRILESSTDRIFLEFVSEYRFDFKHEFAIWKEYQHANSDGMLDAYHGFMMTLRNSDLEEFRETPQAVRQTRNDIGIRQSIFNKIKQKGKHQFLKRLSA